MKITIEDSEAREVVVIESDEKGNYRIKGLNLPRQEAGEYTTNDGLHVIGLIQLIFSAWDSRTYLLRRLNEQGEAMKKERERE